MYKIKYVFLISIALLFYSKDSFSQYKKESNKVQFESGFTNPKSAFKPWAYFWWFNGYVDSTAITRHLTALKDKGIGGVILYPSETGDIPKGDKFMSKGWRENFRFAVKEADRLGLKMGMNICNGWPFGGPWITPANNSWTTVSASTVVQGPKELKWQLPQPLGVHKAYRDVAVYAFPVDAGIDKNAPKVTASSNTDDIPHLFDGNYFTKWTGQKKGVKIDENNPQWINFEYPELKKVDFVWIGSLAFSTPKVTLIQYSENGKDYKTIKRFHTHNYLSQFYGSVPATKAKYFRIVFLKSGGVWPNRVAITDIALGEKKEVYRQMKRGAKEARQGPEGVTSSYVKSQIDFINSPLHPIASDDPIAEDSIQFLTKFVNDKGKLRWKVPKGKWKIVRLGATNTKATAGGGLMGNYMSKKAVDQVYQNFLKLIIEDAGPYLGKTFQYLHEDNVEIEGPYNWTPGFLEKFRKRRGYDPRPYLPVLSGEIVKNIDVSNRFLNDYRRTIADLVTSNHYEYLTALAHKNKLKMQAEAGGPNLPFIFSNDALANLGRMDVPVAEFWESNTWKENEFDFAPPATNKKAKKAWAEKAQNINAKAAASAGHIYGKPIIAAEAFTSLGPNSQWGLGPSDLLLYANIAFCEGINRFIIHSSTTTKKEDGLPGYEYGAGTHFNQNVTWWKDVSPFLKFLGRSQYMLRQGKFVADVLYYNGDQVPNVVLPKHLIKGLGKGYDYDVCNAEVLLNKLTVKKGQLVLPDGMTYKVLVLPKHTSMNLAVLKKIKKLILKGATVIGPKPTQTIGLKNYPKADQELESLTKQIWGSIDGKKVYENKLGKGRVFWGKSARAVLQDEGVRPDFAFSSKFSKANIDYIHRRKGSTDIYFIANRRDTVTNLNISLRVAEKAPELWNPFTGKIEKATAFSQHNGKTMIPIKLDPYGSTFVVFRDKIPITENGTTKNNYPKILFDQPITGPYKITFVDPITDKKFKKTLNDLQDWSKMNDPKIKYFSGTARYAVDFKFSTEKLKNSKKRFVLDLGSLQNTARVYLNGKDLGVVWKAPYRVDVTDYLQKKNSLEIRVTNSWYNKLIGENLLPGAERTTNTNIHLSFTKNLRTSGIIGPIRIGFYKKN